MNVLTIEILARRVYKYYLDQIDPMHGYCWDDLRPDEKFFWLDIARNLLHSLASDNYVTVQ